MVEFNRDARGSEALLLKVNTQVTWHDNPASYLNLEMSSEALPGFAPVLLSKRNHSAVAQLSQRKII